MRLNLSNWSSDTPPDWIQWPLVVGGRTLTPCGNMPTLSRAGCWRFAGFRTTRKTMSEENMNNFTPRAQQVLALARKEADRFGHNFVGTEHLLLGLIKLGQGWR